MVLRDERVRGFAADLDPDLAAAGRNVIADHAVGHDPFRLVLVQQPVEDPLRGVPLLARRVEIVPQPGVDHLPVRIQTRTALLLLLPRLGPRGLKRGRDRGVANPMLALQRAARQSRASITPDRRV